MNNLLQRIKSFAHTKKIITSLLLGTLGGFALFYIFLPPINLQAVEFWIFLTALLALAVLAIIVSDTILIRKNKKTEEGEKKDENEND